ncbi:MAG: F0F1 ATP synthase subunit B [Actinobacteria bacterium]|nr:F0F1 ATP synthase subunit B [Actinomycetota bacterium]
MRRTRLLVAAVALVVVGALGTGSWAGAQDAGGTTTKATKAGEECIKKLEQGAEIDACQQAPNPLVPATNELIWVGIAFVVVFGFLAKFGYPAVKKGLDARADKIRGDLEGAESAKSQAEQVLAEYRAQLADARAESGRIIEEARQAADSIKRDQEQRLQAELAEMRQRAAADIEASKQQAIADLRHEVAALAIGAAEKVVGRNLDRDTNTQLVEQFIAQVGSQP